MNFRRIPKHLVVTMLLIKAYEQPNEVFNSLKCTHIRVVNATDTSCRSNRTEREEKWKPWRRCQYWSEWTDAGDACWTLSTAPEGGTQGDVVWNATLIQCEWGESTLFYDIVSSCQIVTVRWIPSDNTTQSGTRSFLFSLFNRLSMKLSAFSSQRIAINLKLFRSLLISISWTGMRQLNQRLNRL